MFDLQGDDEELDEDEDPDYKPPVSLIFRFRELFYFSIY